MRFARAAVPEPAPTLARRMRHHRAGTLILASIALFVPRVDARKVEVAASRCDKKSGDHARLS